MGNNDEKKDDSVPPDPFIILNPCLSFIHSMMKTRDKSDIKDKTLSGFDLKDLMKAREAVFSPSMKPGEKYVYQGPHKSNAREKRLQAFDGIFKKMKEIDAADSPIIYACSSGDLHLLPPPASIDHAPCTEKINNLQMDMQQQIDMIKATFHSFTGIVAGKPDTVTSLKSTTNMRPRSESLKRKPSDSNVGDDAPDKSVFVEASVPDLGFSYQRDYRRKMARLDSKNQPPAANVAKPAQSQNTRREVWGKAEANTAGFRGVPPKPRFVPQVFLYRCDPAVSTEENVKSYFISKSIKVLEVKQVSSAEAHFKSFKISVEKREDYDKLLSGNCIPEHVRARRFWSPRSDTDGTSNSRYFRAWESSSSVAGAASFKDKVDELNKTLNAALGGDPASMDTGSDSDLVTESPVASAAASTEEIVNNVITRDPTD
tara:strand:+ start:24 stop:1310 length:1287 start_codon:yes stop_codon:yes gene_type:complete